jgi:hypothetical protein
MGAIWMGYLAFKIKAFEEISIDNNFEKRRYTQG